MPMSNVAQITNRCKLISDCADIWEKSGVSRVRTIIRTAGEISQLVQPTSDQSVDRIHPESMNTLRQLVKLHGAKNVIAAVNKLAE